jgi:hypothetical protein
MGKKLQAPTNTFDNPERIAALYEHITSSKTLEEIQQNMVKVMQQKNKDRLKKLLAGRAEELSPDVSLCACSNHFFIERLVV